MKKLLLVFAMMVITGVAYSQNKLGFKNQTKSTVGIASVLFTDGTSSNYEIGGSGTYLFNIGTKEVETITINGVSCAVGQTVTITLSGGGTAQETLTKKIQDESRSFNSIIR